LQKVVESEGADFAPIEPVLTRVMIAAGEAYAAACQLRLLTLQQQRLSREAEAERLRATSHLVMGVAHELNTPLEIISQAAELVARDGNDDIREAAQLISSNVTRASQLIRRFRGLSVGETDDAIQPVDVADTVADAIVLFRRTSVHEPKLDIHVLDEVGHAEGDTRWQGYPLYFTHVLVNLLSNAEHHAYRDAGGPVDIVLERRDDRLNVTVADHGVGIPESALDNVLHPFFTTGRSRGRTGLGMAVVYNLVTAGMHGTLDIDSQLGVGTRVLLDLPWRDPSANSEGRDRVISR
jgi:signal transduction histidine kinase